MTNGNRSISVLDACTLMVIAAVVLAVIIPGMVRSRADANLAKCEANLHAIGTALATYANNNSDLMPQSWTFFLPGWTAGPQKLKVNLTWCEALVIDGALKQEMYRVGDTPARSAHYPASGFGVFVCPSHDKMYQNKGGDAPTSQGYGLAWCATSEFGEKGSNPFVPGPIFVRTAKLVPDHIIAAEGYTLLATASQATYNGGPSPYGIYERHRMDNTLGANFLFADYHVEWSDTYARVKSPLYYGARTRQPLVPPVWVHP